MNRANRKTANVEGEGLRGSLDVIERLRTIDHALKARDLAQLFGVTQQHIYKLAARGVIPSFRVGAAVRFDPNSVAEWLRGKMLPQAFGIAVENKIAV